MPSYGTPQAGGLTAVYPGDALTLFAGETPTAPQASVVFARGMSPSGDDAGITFQSGFADNPTAVLEVLGSNIAPAADFALLDWAVLYTSTDKQTDSYTDTNRFAYYCVYLPSQSAGGAITVAVQR